MRKALALTTAAAAVVVGVAAAPAAQACALIDGVDPCVATNSITLNTGVSGVLSLSNTLPVTTLVTTGTTAAGVLGTTTIGDLRGNAPSSWTYAVKSSGFALAGVSAPSDAGKIAADKMKIHLTAVTPDPLGTVALTAGYPTTAAAGVVLNADGSLKSILSATTTNVNTSTFIPNLTVDIAGKTAGVYTGTVTQSVS